MIDVKIAEKSNKKCCSCKKFIKVGMKYIEFSYNYVYSVEIKRKENKELDGLKKIFKGMFGNDKSFIYGEYDTRRKIKYKRYCEDCLFWAFEKHLKGKRYDDWLVKQTINKL